MCAKTDGESSVVQNQISINRPALSGQHSPRLLERYELLFKATHDVIYDLDLETGKVQWNDALYDHYGYSRREPVDTIEWWTQHIHPDDALKLETAFSDFLGSRQLNWQNEYRFRLHSGIYVVVRDRGYVIRTPKGKPLRVIGSFLDVTKERQLNRAKDEFISLASHQLKTPLSIIRTYCEMLTQGMLGDLTSQQERHVRRITAASIRLIHLVNGILDISRFELDNLTVTKSRFNLARFIEDAIMEVREMANERGVELKLQAPSSKLFIHTDRLLLGHVVNNLLVNAITYSPGRNSTVTVSIAKRTTGFTIRIRDEGIGIPEQDQQQVFSRFFRASNAINASEQGSGLGLYLVKLLTDALNGQVWFRSKEHEGTIFFIRLPAGK